MIGIYNNFQFSKLFVSLQNSILVGFVLVYLKVWKCNKFHLKLAFKQHGFELYGST